MLTLETIDFAFGGFDLAPPPVALNEDGGEPTCWELTSCLSDARMSWRELAAPGRMELLSADAAEWTECLPPPWFLHYLPAMMTRTLSPKTAFECNLLGCLLHYLAPGRHATDRHVEIAQVIYASTSEFQRGVVADFVAKHQAPGGIGASDA